MKLTNQVRALESENREKFWSPDPGGRGWTSLSQLLTYMQRGDGRIKRLGQAELLEWRDLQKEIRDLQFDSVTWYRGNQLESIVHQPVGVLQAKFYLRASRVLQLHNVKLTEEMIGRELIRGLQRNDVKLTRELLAKDLGDSLQLLIVSLALVN